MSGWGCSSLARGSIVPAPARKIRAAAVRSGAFGGRSGVYETLRLLGRTPRSARHTPRSAPRCSPRSVLTLAARPSLATGQARARPSLSSAASGAAADRASAPAIRLLWGAAALGRGRPNRCRTKRGSRKDSRVKQAAASSRLLQASPVHENHPRPGRPARGAAGAACRRRPPRPRPWETQTRAEEKSGRGQAARGRRE